MSDPFRDKQFTSRFTAMGDEAEDIFERVATRGFARYGINRPPIQLRLVPEMVRYTPDYLQGDCLVEVQGVGRDRICKLKVDKHAALLQWNTIFQTDLFVWDNVDRVYAQFPIKDFPVELCALGAFPEGKPYFAVNVEALPASWSEVDDAF